MAKKKTNDEAIEAEIVETKTKNEEPSQKKSPEYNPETFSRVFYTILLSIIGWVTLWVFCFVVIIQFGFLLIAGQVNTNLKGFNKEVGLFLFDIIKYLSFQSNEKPFPFRDWPYDEKENNKKNSELNETDAVKTGK